MPFIVIKITEGRSSEQKKELMKAITVETSRILQIAPENVRTVIEEYSLDHWGVGGVALSDKK